MEKKDDLFEKIKINVVQGRRNSEDEGLDEDLAGTPGIEELVKDALGLDIEAKEILVGPISAGMNIVGDRFESGEYFLPDMLTAAEAVDAATQILEPYLIDAGIEPKGKVVLSTVKGDIHDIGKNIVGLMLKGAGFEVIDLGADVEPATIAEQVKDAGATIVGLSALLTTTMPEMEETIKQLEAAGIREGVKVMVGGAPVSEDFAKDIGADGFGKDAFEAVRLANSYMSGD